MGRTNLLKVEEGVFIARGQIKPLGKKTKKTGRKTGQKNGPAGCQAGRPDLALMRPVARPVGPAQQPGSSSAGCEAQSAARPVGPGLSLIHI